MGREHTEAVGCSAESRSQGRHSSFAAVVSFVCRVIMLMSPGKLRMGVNVWVVAGGSGGLCCRWGKGSVSVRHLGSKVVSPT